MNLHIGVIILVILINTQMIEGNLVKWEIVW